MSDSEKTSEAGLGFSPAASSGAVNRAVPSSNRRVDMP